MDFDTLKRRLNKGKYSFYEDFLADMMLIWDNCKLYNMRKSEIYKLSERMEKMTKKEIEKFKESYSLQHINFPPLISKHKDKRDRKDREGRDADFIDDTPTSDQKQEFATQAKLLNNEGLKILINKIKSVQALSITDFSDKKI